MCHRFSSIGQSNQEAEHRLGERWNGSVTGKVKLGVPVSVEQGTEVGSGLVLVVCAGDKDTSEEDVAGVNEGDGVGEGVAELGPKGVGAQDLAGGLNELGNKG